MRLQSVIVRVMKVLCIAITVIALGQHGALAQQITVPPGSNLPIAVERELLVVAFRLMLFVAVPVLLLTVLFAWRFRASNVEVARQPHPGKAKVVEIVTWFIPAVLILVLGTMLWRQTHLLDPYRSLDDGGLSTVVHGF